MSEPAIQLQAVGEATETMHGVAKQALEWVRVSEKRVAKAEARSEEARAELKERAMATLRKLGEEGRARLAAERGKRREAEARATRAEESRDRAEKAFEQLQQRAQLDREVLAGELVANRAEAGNSLAETVANLEREAERRARDAHEEVQLEADRRVAAAEQRAADAEAAANEAHETAVRLETEIDRRVMEGTEEVRREAEERVRKLVEKVEREAEEFARARAEDQLQAESSRIRQQAERREERARQVAEDEIKATANKAKREALAAADETAPAWARSESAVSTAGYRTF